MSFSVSARGKTVTLTLVDLEAKIAADQHAPKDNRAGSAAAGLLTGFTHDAPEGRVYYANVSGHTEPAGSRGTSYINVAVGEAQAGPGDEPQKAAEPAADTSDAKLDKATGTA